MCRPSSAPSGLGLVARGCQCLALSGCALRGVLCGVREKGCSRSSDGRVMRGVVPPAGGGRWCEMSKREKMVCKGPVSVGGGEIYKGGGSRWVVTFALSFSYRYYYSSSSSGSSSYCSSSLLISYHHHHCCCCCCYCCCYYCCDERPIEANTPERDCARAEVELKAYLSQREFES